jgi:hypothetical protein
MEDLRDEFGKKNWVFELLSKNTQFQKKNQPKRSSENEVMNILNSTVFQGFFGKKPQFSVGNLLFYFLGFFRDGGGTAEFIGCSNCYQISVIG